MRTDKIKKPVTKGVARVPVIMQLEMLECGAACLTMIMGYYEKRITLEQAHVDCGVSRDGSSARNILQAARSYGMECHGYRMEPEVLLEEGAFPCIIHWRFNHFVVLDGFTGKKKGKKKAVLNDPARGRVTVPWEEFDRNFTGVCLTIEPGEGFVPEGRRKSVWDYTKERMAAVGSSSYLWKIMRLPMQFFDQRLPGDLAGTHGVWPQYHHSETYQ